MNMKRQFKTVKKLSGQKKYRKWDEYDIGDIVIGKFVGIHTDQYKKECPMIQVLDAQFKDGTGETFVGGTLVLNACGVLAKAMENVTEGEIIQVEYQGTSEIQKGPYKGKDAHVMAVEIVELDEDAEESEPEVDL